MLSNLQYRILKKISPGEPDCCSGRAYEGKSKLRVLMGEEFFASSAARVVIDFGCGKGTEAVEMALRGARRVIGIDIRESVLAEARQQAHATGVQNTRHFACSTTEQADIIVSIDAFEHFSEPAKMLLLMSTLLRPTGRYSPALGPPGTPPGRALILSLSLGSPSL